MTGKEIVRLINRLKKEGMTDAKILDIIKDVTAPELKETTDSSNSDKTDNDNGK